MDCFICGKDLTWSSSFKNLKGRVVCDDCLKYCDLDDKTVSDYDRYVFFYRNYDNISKNEELKKSVDEWLSGVPQSVIDEAAETVKQIENEKNSHKEEKTMKNDSDENSVGLEITGIVEILWKINFVSVIAGIISLTIFFANTYTMWGEHRGGGDIFRFFIISVIVGVFELLGAYVIKLLLRGFGELISDTKEIKKMLKKQDQEEA